MRKVFILLFILLTVVSCNAQEFVPGEILIKFNENLNKPIVLANKGNLVTIQRFTKNKIEIVDILKADMAKEFTSTKAAVEVINTSKYTGISRVKVPVGQELNKINELKTKYDVESIEPNYIYFPDDLTVNDPYFSNQWNLTAAHIPTLWDFSTGDQDVIVAVCDSGVMSNHPDLSGQFITGWNFVDDNTNTADIFGHGTKVTGTIAAVGNNSIGVAGVAWNCTFMPIRIDDYVIPTNGKATLATMEDSITYAAQNGAKIINMSYGGPYSGGLASVIDTAYHTYGALVFASVGNEATTALRYPAACEHVIAVGSVDINNQRAGSSNYGYYLHVLAPEGTYTTNNSGDYSYHNGTSYASPTTAGLAALLLSYDYTLTPDNITNIIQYSCDDIYTPGFDNDSGYGKINAARAISFAQTYPSMTYVFTGTLVDNTTLNQHVITLTSTSTVHVNLTYTTLNPVTMRMYNHSNSSLIKSMGITRSPLNMPYGTFNAGTYRFNITTPVGSNINYTLTAVVTPT